MEPLRKKSSFDRTIRSLCNEIDYLSEENNYLKEQIDLLKKEMQENFQREWKTTQEGLANALRFAMAAEDDADGNLVIPKEKRSSLAKNYK